MKEIRRALVILFGVCGFIAILHLTDASLPPSLPSLPSSSGGRQRRGGKQKQHPDHPHLPLLQEGQTCWYLCWG